jgi:hypothetical protein
MSRASSVNMAFTYRFCHFKLLIVDLATQNVTLRVPNFLVMRNEGFMISRQW